MAMRSQSVTPWEPAATPDNMIRVEPLGTVAWAAQVAWPEREAPVVPEEIYPPTVHLSSWLMSAAQQMAAGLQPLDV